MIGPRQDPTHPLYGAFSLPYTEPRTDEDKQVWRLLSHSGFNSAYSTTLLKCPLVPLAGPMSIQKPGPVALDWKVAKQSCAHLLRQELLTERVDLWLGIGMEVMLQFQSSWRASLLQRWTFPTRWESLPSAWAHLVSLPLPEARSSLDILLLPSPSAVDGWVEAMSPVVDTVLTRT